MNSFHSCEWVNNIVTKISITNVRFCAGIFEILRVKIYHQFNNNNNNNNICYNYAYCHIL